MEKTLRQKEQSKIKVINVLQKRLGKKAKALDPQKEPFDKLIEELGQMQEKNFKFRKLR